MPNQILPSAPNAIARGWLCAVGMANSVSLPSGVMRPIRLPKCSENQMLPSAPMAMIRGELSGLGSGYSTSPPPSGSMLPMRLPPLSVNHKRPFGATEIVVGALPRFGSAKECTTPSVVRLLSALVSQRCGSGMGSPARTLMASSGATAHMLSRSRRARSRVRSVRLMRAMLHVAMPEINARKLR
jgi:hypothetical protein